jgi:hypothetical protein
MSLFSRATDEVNFYNFNNALIKINITCIVLNLFCNGLHSNFEYARISIAYAILSMFIYAMSRHKQKN